jgi:hypothetical protein
MTTTITDSNHVLPDSDDDSDDYEPRAAVQLAIATSGAGKRKHEAPGDTQGQKPAKRARNQPKDKVTRPDPSSATENDPHPFAVYREMMSSKRQEEQMAWPIPRPCYKRSLHTTRGSEVCSFESHDFAAARDGLNDL